MCHLVAITDLARLYKCANGTKSINLVVNRNIERFPEDFYFQLTKEEYNNLGGVRKLPYVFMEQGIAMLVTVLRTKIASQINF